MSGIENNENAGAKDNHIFPEYVDERTARVVGHGLVSTEVGNQAPNHQSKLPEILDKIKDPKVPSAEIIRLIAHEMALINQDMRLCETDGAAGFKLKICTERIRALHAVAEAAKESDACDVLNFDGPKFIFVFSEIVNYFKDAAQKVLKDDRTTEQNIMKHFRDNISVNEAELRRKTKRIGRTGPPPLTSPSEPRNLEHPKSAPNSQAPRAESPENRAADNPKPCDGDDEL
jgi:hypothetical protein